MPVLEKKKILNSTSSWSRRMKNPLFCEIGKTNQKKPVIRHQFCLAQPGSTQQPVNATAELLPLLGQRSLAPQRGESWDFPSLQVEDL